MMSGDSDSASTTTWRAFFTELFGEPAAAGTERKTAGMPPQRAAKAPEPPKPDPVEELKAARQGGYQDGYRDGLEAQLQQLLELLA